ncbi:MSMEG_0570 family nitrogen starvation response protein [Acidisphaera rubrifaciens]|uniref:NAD/NADP transhydrogenase alpha subunit n=1 Tax=Acidisphaera rubrifaciens HS-AP3 TaxID=1231350 RepID=A0A0D6P8N4_9PROT|nr:MSMEG_0570 family nitrogen starvation response protein [Acidisphaera rubrifaciens]GAN78042.1 hypothetical protein Asru_0586_03 [Acidisphaera rubrifaciens HS-AP3]
MPALLFDVRWPDGEVSRLYSPSTVIGSYLAAGARYPLADFVVRARAAMQAASERVRAVHGFPCSRAAATLDHIETQAGRYPPDAHVAVERILHG